MLVAEFMQKPTLLISAHDSIQLTITKLINLGSSGALVEDNGIIVGAISEKDILAQLYPSQQEFMEKTYLRDFEEMETNIKQVFSKKVKDLMRVNIHDAYVYPTSSIIHVLSVMTTYGFSHLPVINHKKEILGEVNQRDIFQSLIGSETPFTTVPGFHNWSAGFYDLIHEAKNRYENEIQSLDELFKKNKVKTVLDMGYASGNHAIRLAKLGYNVVGIERCKVPFKIASAKREKLAEIAKNRVEFVYTEDYIPFLHKSSEVYDAVIILGNILNHYRSDWQQILKAAYAALSPNGVLVIQTSNTYRILRWKDGLFHSTIAQSKLTPHRQYSITVFYDRPWGDQDRVLLTMSVLRFDGKIWTKEAINSVRLVDFKADELKKVLTKEVGFKKVDVFGCMYAGRLFDKPFSLEKDEGFIHVAYKGGDSATKSGQVTKSSTITKSSPATKSDLITGSTRT